jgi:hypothetical protein
LVQEIKDYSDLECQLTDVMDSNDIYRPTSKDDPNYLTLLEFLRQFLPKGLYQTLKPNHFTLLGFLRQFLPKGRYQTIDDKKVMSFPHQTLNV